jgi:hypothetical protein
LNGADEFNVPQRIRSTPFNISGSCAGIIHQTTLRINARKRRKVEIS